MIHLKNHDGSLQKLRPVKQCQACAFYVQSSKTEGRGMCAFFSQLVGATDECAEFKPNSRMPASGRVQRA